MTAQRIEITAEEASALLDRLKNSVSATDYQIIKGLVDTHLLFEQMVSEKNTSINRLLKMIFGHKTEKAGKGNGSKKKTTKPKGHGKNGAGNYVGAQHKKIKHAILHHCDPCPACREGKLYRQPVPGMIVRIKGAPPLQATVYEQEKLRCNICGKVFTADLPPEAGLHKYDETASAMLAVLRVRQRPAFLSHGQIAGGHGHTSCPINSMGYHRKTGRPGSSGFP